jgi:hypothetical protein
MAAMTKQRTGNRMDSGSRHAEPLALELVRGDLGTAWIHVAGPLLGALIGAAFEWILRGNPTSAAAIAAQGSAGAGEPTQTSGQQEHEHED